MESGDRSGDNVPDRSPQQRGVSPLQLQFGLHRVHLLHQSVGHPGLSQVHPNTDVSVTMLTDFRLKECTFFFSAMVLFKL